MSAEATFSFLRLDPESFSLDLTTFDCGVEGYNRWLAGSAVNAAKSGTSAVHLLVRDGGNDEPPRVLGYLAVAPTAVARDDLPGAVSRGMPRMIPGYLLAKMALDTSVRGDPRMRWGTQLVVQALRVVVEAATAGGGRVIVVDADNEGLIPFYKGHSFLPTGVNPLRLYMKVATARSLLDQQPARPRTDGAPSRSSVFLYGQVASPAEGGTPAEASRIKRSTSVRGRARSVRQVTVNASVESS